MTRAPITQVLQDVLLRRVLPGGGLADRPGGQYRTDATAWGTVALAASNADRQSLDRLRSRLLREQQRDGRLCIESNRSDSYWPTPIAILAWRGDQACESAKDRAIAFVLTTTGNHYAAKSEEPAGHDTFLKGWPWISGTHSWIEPTAVAVIALNSEGYGGHARIREAKAMILDRQLPHGGWNYGNSFVFGQELRPMPETTGAALASLAGMVDRQHIEKALDYLLNEVGRLTTPISLGWSLIGLAAWNLWPANGVALVERCLVNQSRFGEYDTSSLSLLFLGALAGQPDDNLNVSGFPRAGRLENASQ